LITQKDKTMENENQNDFDFEIRNLKKLNNFRAADKNFIWE